MSWTRAALALVFAVAFTATIGCSFVGILLQRNPDNVKDWLLTVLPAETGLFGTAFGFFFGSQSRQ
jgi:hypothetical protein